MAAIFVYSLQDIAVITAALQGAVLHFVLALLIKQVLDKSMKRITVREVCKYIWEVVEELRESVLDTVEDCDNKNLINQWDLWFMHPNVSDYKHALLSDQKESKL